MNINLTFIRRKHLNYIHFYQVKRTFDFINVHPEINVLSNLTRLVLVVICTCKQPVSDILFRHPKIHVVGLRV